MPTVNKKTEIADVKAEAAAAGLPLKNGKQAIGFSRIKHPGEPGINYYYLEDDTEIMEDDGGQPVASWPELPMTLMAKRAKD